MALQIRRGLNQERLNITPLAGEVVHVTDWKAKTKLITAVNSNDTITSASHGWVNGDQVMYKGPTAYGLTQGTIYFIRDAAAGSYKLSTVEALTDTVNITATASGLNYPVTSGPKDADGDVVGTSVAPMWIGDGETVGGVAVGAWTLDDLYDVEIASDSDGDGLAGDNLANEQHLEYDASTQQWYNRSNMIIPGTLLTRSNVTFGDTGDETVTFYSPTVSAPNDLNINSGQLFVDQSTGFIGVGDTTPSYKLDVAGSIRAVGDITIDGQDLISSTTTFNLVNTTATTVNTGGAATTYNIGHSSGTGDTYIRNDLTANQNADVLGNLTVNGNTTLGNASGDLVTVNAGEILMTASQPFISFGNTETSPESAEAVRGIRGQIGGTDKWFVGAGATASDQGYLLIAMGDNTESGIAERIIVRKTGGSGTANSFPWDPLAPVVAEMELFDVNNYTTIPNRLGIGITPTVKLDVNGSGVFRGDYLTTEGELRANGGSITSSQATLTINAGGQVTIDDNLTVSGNLTVNGTTTTVNSTTLTVDDKNIELASTATPSDTTANGGGITLKGTTDKTIIWDQVTGRWTFNQDIESTGGLLGAVDVGIADNSGIFATAGDLNLNAAGGEVRTLCDFVAEGELRTHDNQITFKSAVTGSPSESVIIQVERGTSANVALRWNESTDRWGYTNDGTNYINFANQSLDTTDTPTFAGATLGNITVGVSADGTITTTTGDLTIDSATNEVIVDASLRVTGDFRTDDNIFRLNFNNTTGSPAMTDNAAGMAVRRGSSADAQLLWDETADRWEHGVQGSLRYLPNQDLDSTDSPSFADLTLTGDLTVGGNDIKSSGGTTAVTFSGANVSVAGDLTVTGNDIKSSSATALTLNGADVAVAGDLTVTGNDIKSSSATALTLSGADVAVAGDLTVTGNDIKGSGGTTALTLNAGSVTVADDLTVTGNTINLAQGTDFVYSENNNRLNRPTLRSTTGNTSGFRVQAPNATSSAIAISAVFNTNDPDNGKFINIRTDGSAGPLSIRTGEYVSGVFGASGNSIDVYDGSTKYASMNPAGPTASTDLITKSYLEAGTSELAQVKLDDRAVLDTATLTTSATTADQVLDSNSATTYRSVKYLVQITSGTDYQSVECLIIHNGTTASITTYADIKTGSTDLATFAADISGGNVRLLTTPTNAVTTYKVVKTLVTA